MQEFFLKPLDEEHFVGFFNLYTHATNAHNSQLRKEAWLPCLAEITINQVQLKANSSADKSIGRERRNLSLFRIVTEE